MNLRLRALRSLYRDRLEVVLTSRTFDGKVAVALPLTFKELESSELIEEPTFYIDGGEGIAAGTFQELFDELWRMGCRPRDYSPDSTVDAIKYHLEDMRKLVFGNDR